MARAVAIGSLALLLFSFFAVVPYAWAQEPGQDLAQDRYTLTRQFLAALGWGDEAAIDPILRKLPSPTRRATPEQWLARSASLFKGPVGAAPVMSLDGNLLRVYRDANSKSVPDFEVELAARPVEIPLPARRLRIAVDPGHMGGSPWDLRTGKFIRESREPGTRFLSEGTLALQTALVLEKLLLAQGHEVMLTRRKLEPVSDLPFEKLDLNAWGGRALRQKTQTGMFAPLLDIFARGGVAAVRLEPRYQDLFSEKQRGPYYFQGEDIVARVEKIEDYAPDLTLVLHYDIQPSKDKTADPNGINPQGYNGTKVYVPGGVFDDELGTREERAYTVIQGLDQVRWVHSVRMAELLVDSLTRNLGIPPDPSDMGNSVRVSPGVYARNLHLSRKITTGTVAYIEALFYSAPAEFEAFFDFKSQGAGSTRIGNDTFLHSARLARVAASIAEAVANFTHP